MQPSIRTPQNAKKVNPEWVVSRVWRLTRLRRKLLDATRSRRGWNRPVFPAWVTSTGKRIFRNAPGLATQIYRYPQISFPIFPATPSRSVPGYSRAQRACHPLKSFIDGTKTRGGRVDHGRCTIHIREHQRLEQPLQWLYIVVVAEVMGSGRLEVIISVAIYEPCPTTNSRSLCVTAGAAVAWV